MRPTNALLTAFATGLFASCSYDWQVAPPDDAGSDAGSDAGADAATDAGDAGPNHDAGPDCASLTTKLDAARSAAKACTLGVAGSCEESIVDECGCTSYVKQGGSAAAGAFASAVHDFTARGCTRTCSECLLSPGACLLQGGTQAVCVP